MDSDQANGRAMPPIPFRIQMLSWWLRYRSPDEVAADIAGRVRSVALPESRSARAAEEVRAKSYWDFDLKYGVDTTGWIPPACW